MSPELWDAVRDFAKGRFFAGGAFGRDLVAGDPKTFTRFAVALAAYQFDLGDRIGEENITDGHRDLGIDGILLCVDGRMIRDEEDANELLADIEPGAVVDFRWILLQTKKGGHFDASDFADFVSGAQIFLHPDENAFAAANANDLVGEWRTLRRIIDEGFAECDAQPVVSADLVYAWGGAAKLGSFEQMRIEREMGTLRAALTEAVPNLALHLWKEVADRASGESDLVRMAERASLARERILAVDQAFLLPPGEAGGFVAVAAATEAVKLMMSEDESRRDDRAFYDNVRHFLGDGRNRVNREIKATLIENRQRRFVLLNNGLTVVARSAALSPSGREIALTDYQFVNGCQTLTTLYRNRESLDGAFVLMKIVVSIDDDLTDAVIRATNTQSPIDRANMLARVPYVRRLQAYFRGRRPAGGNRRLFLERRQGEHHRITDDERDLIVTPKQLLEAFGAAVLGRPHAAHANPGLLLDLAGKTIFHDDHEPEVYYGLGWAIVLGRQWARTNGLDWRDGMIDDRRSRGYAGRHQLVFAMRHLVAPGLDLDKVTGPAARAVWGDVVARLSDPNEGPLVAAKAGRLVALAAGGKLTAEKTKQEAFTRTLRASLNAAKALEQLAGA